MAFKFSRGASVVSQSQSANSNLKSKSASNTPSINSTNHYKSGAYPAWLKDGAALRKAYYGLLGQVQIQPALDSAELPKDLDKLVSSRKQEFSWDKFADSSRVQQLLSTSQLPNSSLAAIWACCNKTRPGVLTNREVCLALGLIAIFQRVQDQQLEGDPFNLLKLEKGPPVPKLYGATRNTSKSRIPSSCSAPDDLLIDITNESTDIAAATNSTNSKLDTALQRQQNPYENKASNNLVSLIDLDIEELEPTLTGLASVWLRVMVSMQILFKRSFDVLNVENSRLSALEALASPDGANFCKCLSLCYPIAHNIKFKIDELKDAKGLESKQSNPLSDKYLSQISNIMVSINEYWAVLVNLFHASGQMDFIELIMDGLVKTPNEAVSSRSLDELIGDLMIDSKCETCAICLTEFYLINMGDALERSAKLSKDDIDMLYDTKLISLDSKFFYHPKCANFWLNNVSNTNGKLPFGSRPSGGGQILEPTK